MGYKVPPLGHYERFSGNISQILLKDFHYYLKMIEDKSKELSFSFAISSSDIQEIYQYFCNARRLSTQVATLSFEQEENEKLRQKCLNRFAILQAGLCIEEEAGSRPD